MAKKKVKEAILATGPSDYKPSLYLDLEGKDVSQVKSLQVGQDVEILVRGKVRGLSQRKSMRYLGDDKEKEVQTGNIDLEGYSVEVLGTEDNEFAELSDDEDEA